MMNLANMTKKKKMIIGFSAGIALAVILALLLIFVFDVFGIYTSAYKLDYDKYVTAGTYKGLQYDKVKVKVTDKEVQEEIQNRLNAKATTKTVKKGTVKNGDTISISYIGKINGKTFSGGSADNSTITIGQTQMIDGFTAGLIGKKVGSKVKLHLKFPKNYAQNEKLSGKKVVFEVTINSKQVQQTPKYDTAFVKANSEYKTKAEYEKSVKADLKKSKQSQAENNVKNSLWNQVVAASKVKSYPARQLAYEEQKIKERYEKMAKSYNMDWAKFLKTYMKSDEESFAKQTKEYAKTVVKQKLVMHAIAKKEGIELSDKEYDEYLSGLLKNAGFTKDSFKSQYNETIEEYAEENDFKTNLLLQKVTDKIKSYGKEK